MPISSDRKHFYKTEMWKFISEFVRIRAWGRCEICNAKEGDPHPITGSKVVLTCMHLSHDSSSYRMSDIAAACQRCHNAYDAPVRAENRRRRIRIDMENSQLVFSCFNSLKMNFAGNEVSVRQGKLYEVYQTAVDAANFRLNQEWENHANSAKAV